MFWRKARMVSSVLPQFTSELSAAITESVTSRLRGLMQCRDNRLLYCKPETRAGLRQWTESTVVKFSD
jgi:hypothetical protein